MSTNTRRLAAALERGQTLHEQIGTAGPRSRAELLAGWKKSIAKELRKILKLLEDPKLLSSIDFNIAVAQDLFALEASEREAPKKHRKRPPPRKSRGSGIRGKHE